MLAVSAEACASRISQFNRTFCRRFGETPSGVRAASTMWEQS
jgi:hypothetical protein